MVERSPTLPPPPSLGTGPEVRLVNAFVQPYANAVATARTCYSAKGIVTTEDVLGPPGQAPEAAEKKAATRDRIARSIYEAGHHTTLQHAHFQFALSRVSRQFLWTFLHSHPFYNSEQVSQRYVEVKPEHASVPPLQGEARATYLACLERQGRDYHRLIELLTPVCEREYFRIFRVRSRDPGRWKQAIHKRAMEVARYALPVATHACLYHTVSGLTLLRYWRMCMTMDAPREQREVVGEMVRQLLEHDPLFATLLEEPLPLEQTPEHAFFAASPGAGTAAQAAACRAEFDRALGGRTSLLVDWKARNEASVAQGVREVLGLPSSALADDDALALVLDPSRNRLLGETMNVTTLGKLSRALSHASYTFQKRLSHTADSQDQRHRMTPASRPTLRAYLCDEPDVVVPPLVDEDPAVRRAWDESMARSWEAITRLRALGVSDEDRAYMLPNAVALRFTESSDLLNLHHKHRMRLCYNAQEEIWRASQDEALQVRAINPRIGRFLLPPCTQRSMAKRSPVCPEGDRFCGVRVWKMDVADYKRLI
ncbi:MAG: FAD-dependent thymidylate synthase [Planctomycetia bacterium]